MSYHINKNIIHIKDKYDEDIISRSAGSQLKLTAYY